MYDLDGLILSAAADRWKGLFPNRANRWESWRACFRGASLNLEADARRRRQKHVMTREWFTRLAND